MASVGLRKPGCTDAFNARSRSSKRKRSIFRTLATAVDFEQRSELIFMQQPVVPVGDRLGRGLIDVDRLQLA